MKVKRTSSPIGLVALISLTGCYAYEGVNRNLEASKSQYTFETSKKAGAVFECFDRDATRLSLGYDVSVEEGGWVAKFKYNYGVGVGWQSIGAVQQSGRIVRVYEDPGMLGLDGFGFTSSVMPIVKKCI